MTYGGRENGKYSLDFLVTATYSLGQTKKPAWCGLCPGARTIPRLGGSLRIPPGLPICDFPPALQRTPCGHHWRATHGVSHRGSLPSADSLLLLRQCYGTQTRGEGKHCCTGFKSSSVPIPLQTLGKMTPQELLEEDKPEHRGWREVPDKANWQVSHQYWLSTALACLLGGGDKWPGSCHVLYLGAK